MIQFKPPPPGASDAERAVAYANAFLLTETAINELKDQVADCTEEILVLARNFAVFERSFKERHEHTDALLEAVLKRLVALEAGPMRPPAASRDDIRDAVSEGVREGVEQIERRTPATGFQVPNLGIYGYPPAPAPPQESRMTSERVREAIRNALTEEQRNELDAQVKDAVSDQKRKADAWRNAFALTVMTLIGAGITFLIDLLRHLH